MDGILPFALIAAGLVALLLATVWWARRRFAQLERKCDALKLLQKNAQSFVGGCKPGFNDFPRNFVTPSTLAQEVDHSVKALEEGFVGLEGLKGQGYEAAHALFQAGGGG